MSWLPGVGPVKDVSAVGISRGLSENWFSDEPSKKEIKKGNFWDVIDNPLFQVAGEAAGFDWDEWVKDAKGKVGTGPNDGMARVRAVIRAGTPGGRVRTGTKKGGGFTYADRPGTPAEYEWMTKDEADARGLDYEEAKTTRWRNKDTGEIVTGRAGRSGGSRIRVMGVPVDPGPMGIAAFGITGGASSITMGSHFMREDDWEDDWEELRDWGSHDEGVNEDLDGMARWLTDIVSINDHLPKIIREGPKGEHYGIDGDIWAHYGLDQEIEPPKEMNWDSYDKKMQLATAVTSEVGYSTPEGIPAVDLHGD